MIALIELNCVIESYYRNQHINIPLDVPPRAPTTCCKRWEQLSRLPVVSIIGHEYDFYGECDGYHYPSHQFGRSKMESDQKLGKNTVTSHK